MCFTAKESIIAWWILAMMSLFLWYRNDKYDRALSAFVFALGLIQLIEYGIHSGAHPQQSGQALFITLWLQCLVLAIGVFVFFKSNSQHDNNSTTMENIILILSGWNLALFAIIFVIAIIVSFIWTFNGEVGASGHIEWTRVHDNPENNSFLGMGAWLYLFGLLFPLFLIFAYYMFADIGIAVLILYGILSMLYVIANYPPKAFSSMWCYLSIGFAFLLWFFGIIPCNSCAL